MYDFLCQPAHIYATTTTPCCCCVYGRYNTLLYRIVLHRVVQECDVPNPTVKFGYRTDMQLNTDMDTMIAQYEILFVLNLSLKQRDPVLFP